jgi:prepilin-type N-terminal cleavage/methylation domain-containing protein
MRPRRFLPPPASRSALRPGYSLAEVIIVIVIIGVISAMSQPRLSRMRDKTRVYAATERFTRSVFAARQAAIQRGKHAYFKSNANKIWVTVDTTGLNTDSVIVNTTLDMSAAYGVTISPSTLVTIDYDPRGMATQASKQVFGFVHTASGYVDSLCVSKLGNTIRDRCP